MIICMAPPGVSDTSWAPEGAVAVEDVGCVWLVITGDRDAVRNACPSSWDIRADWAGDFLSVATDPDLVAVRSAMP